MDMRSYGKDFDKYYERARDGYGVPCPSRVAKVDRNPDGTLDVVYTTEDDRLVHEPFDLVVLSVGLEPSRGIRTLIDQLDLRRGEAGSATDEFTPLHGARGSCLRRGAGPQDIPRRSSRPRARRQAGRLLAPHAAR